VGVRNNKTLVVLEKICAPFPRESAEKKANADIRRKNTQIDLFESNLKICGPFPRESAEKKS
jgi:hypothetical protein